VVARLKKSAGEIVFHRDMGTKLCVRRNYFRKDEPGAMVADFTVATCSARSITEAAWRGQ